MDFSKEFTISQKITIAGIGVHSGKKSSITLFPAGEGSGVNFVTGKVKIPALINFVKKSSLCTSISNRGYSVKTVEHLLSALYGLGICNIEIVVEGEEIPVLDGSSTEFIKIIRNNVLEQNKNREYLNLPSAVYIRNKEKFIIAIPAPEFSIDYFLDYPKNPPGFLFEKFIFSTDNFIKQISQARTFGFLEDAAYLNEKGLALGSSLENTLVITDEGYSSPLRYYNEPVRHKILDLIGDISFLGKYLNAKIIAYKTGHYEHLLLTERILSLPK